MDTGTFLALVIGLGFGLLLGAALGLGWGRAQTASPSSRALSDQRAADQAVLRDGLDRLYDQLRDLEHSRTSWQGQFNQQVDDMRHTNEALRHETHSLSTALRSPQIRGQWGELHLRRAVELAGLVNRCDFHEQPHLATDNGSVRPDLVVNLAGGGQVIVDAKVPLEAYLQALKVSGREQEQCLQQHARAMRAHVDALGAKRYWRAVSDSPEFVVLFVPAESFLAAALESDPTLLEYAATRRVILAAPTTLIGLLRTVAHGWSHSALAEQAGEVHRLGRELHDRLNRFGAHLDSLGRSLGAALTHYNHAVGSLETRVLVSARRLGDLTPGADELTAPRQIDAAPRSLGGVDPDLTDSARHVRGL
ncbi:MAG: DNA recombination protein RmuC [Nocardioides sp.]